MKSLVRFTLSSLGHAAPRGAVVLAALAMVIVSPARLQAADDLYLIDGTNLYSVDTSNAALTLIGPAYDDGLAPSGDPSFLYCADTNPDLFSLPLDGSPQVFIATIGGDAERGLAFNSKTGVLYGTDNGSFGSINRTTGTFTQLTGPPSEAEAIAADPINNLVYGLATESNPNLMSYDVDTDTWAVVGATLVADGGKGGLAYDPSAKVLFAADRDGSRNLYRIDPATGTTTWIGATGLASGNFGLAFVSSLIFADGFESGTSNEWSATQP